MENTEEKYRIVSMTFKGTESFEGKVYGYKYEITFNKSLNHTGRLDGIEDGLNRYVKKEAANSFMSSFSNVWVSFICWLKTKS